MSLKIIKGLEDLTILQSLNVGREADLLTVKRIVKKYDLEVSNENIFSDALSKMWEWVGRIFDGIFESPNNSGDPKAIGYAITLMLKATELIRSSHNSQMRSLVVFMKVILMEAKKEQIIINNNGKKERINYVL